MLPSGNGQLAENVYYPNLAKAHPQRRVKLKGIPQAS